MEESYKKLAELIKEIKIAMLITQEDDGSLRSRPMATQKTPFDGQLWFFVKDHAPKNDLIVKNPHINLAYSDTSRGLYISVSGKARILKDIEKARKLWTPLYKAWFPEGLNDPELALLRVDVDFAEYWDTPSGIVTQIIGMAKAAITGTEYRPGDHEKVAI